MVRHFFFYGTLQPECAGPTQANLVSGLECLGPASTRGRIFAKLDPYGAYPVLYRGGLGRVRGTVFRSLPDTPPGWLGALDRFEGAAGAGGEYARRPLRVTMQGGEQLVADAYLYLPLPDSGLVPIPHGDFARFLAESGLLPYSR